MKALGDILAAPFLRALGLVAKANPNEGSGIVGIAAANGAFGSQYTPGAIAAQGQQGGAAAYGYGYGGVPGYRGGGYAGDAALLANVPAGEWAPAADLVHGLADCSGSVGNLVDLLDGRTSAQRLNTGNAASWLPAHGFLPGMGGPGDFRVGYNAGHMQATFPEGTNFNWGSDSAAAARGLAPNKGAYDPSLTSHYYRPAMAAPVPPPAAMAPDLYSAANTDPGLNNPQSYGQSTGFGGGSMLPGTGAPQGFPINRPGMDPFASPGVGAAAAPGGGLGSAYPSQGGNSGNILGGMPLDGLMAATSAADMMMPGAGAAAKIGIQVANRTIGYAAQNAGILASGLMETFSLGDNPRASIGGGWLGKIAGGFAGAAPALPNMAGTKAQEQKGGGQQPGNVDNSRGDTNITVNNNKATEDQNGKVIAEHQAAMYAPAGRQ